jgi:hypothetical protein
MKDNVLKKTFTGSIDDLLKSIAQADAESVKEISDPNYHMSRDEAIEYVITEFQTTREKATSVVDAMLMDQFEAIAEGLVEKGFLEVVKYNEDGTKEYGIVEQ